MSTVMATQPTGISEQSRRSLRKIALGVTGVLGFLALWQLLPTLGIVNSEYFPYATDTIARLFTETGDLEFWRNVGRTMTAWGIGLAISVTSALILGTIIGMVPFLRKFTHTTVEFLRPVPSVALIPIAVLTFGQRIEAALALIVFACFWQVFVQVLYGVADIDSVARDTALSFGLTRSQLITQLILPTALPYLMTGLRLAASVALILAVTAEMTINNPGLGNRLMLDYNIGDREGVYAIVIVTGLIGLIINMIFGIAERRVLFWHQSVRGEDPQ